MADYIESEPLRKKAHQEAQRAKLEALEKKLGITPGAGPSTTDPLAGKKHRLEDTEYIEQSRELVDNVKSAVSVGEYDTIQTVYVRHSPHQCRLAMLKKKKKAKTSHSPPAESASTAAAATGKAMDAASAATEKVLESPVTLPVVAAAAVAVGVASA